MVLSAVGLGAVLTESAEIFNFLKILGASYLIYLGVKIWFSPIEKIVNETSVNGRSSKPFSLFKEAFFVTSSNPKALVYVSALLPQFINNQLSLLPQIVTLALTSAVIQFIIFMFYVILANNTRHWLGSPSKRKFFNRFSGITFVGFGVVLGLSKK